MPRPSREEREAVKALAEKNKKKREKYQLNKVQVQKSRVLKALVKLSAGGNEALKGRHPSYYTLKKYKLVNKEGKIVLPDKYIAPKVNYVDVEPPKTPQTINIIRKSIISPVAEYNANNTKVTGKEINDWVWTDLATQIKPNKKAPTGKQTLTMYANTPRNLCNIYGEEYKENDSVQEKFKDFKTTLEWISTYNNWKSPASKAKNLSGILYVIQNFPPLKGTISSTIVDAYDDAYKMYGNKGKSLQKQKTKNTPLYEWKVIRKTTLAFYDYPEKVTEESLIILLYNDIIGRDDFGCIMAYSKDEVLKSNVNYCLLDRKDKKATIILNKYKTSSSYRGQEFELSENTTEAIMTLHPNDTGKTLFTKAVNNKLGGFIIKMFARVPLFKNENIKVNYLRHSIISSALIRIKPSDADYAEKIEALAKKSFHKVGTQDLYTGPLKNKNGRLFELDPSQISAYDEITQQLSGADHESDGEEEVVSRRR